MDVDSGSVGEGLEVWSTLLETGDEFEIVGIVGASSVVERLGFVVGLVVDLEFDFLGGAPAAFLATGTVGLASDKDIRD